MLVNPFAVRADTGCQRAKLTASGGAPHDLFGYSVATSGNVAVVATDHNGLTGAAYVFERSGSVWELVAKLVNEGAGGGSRVGRCVDVDADFAVIGATRTWTAIFQRSESDWSQVAQLRPDDDISDSLYGYAVSLSAGHTVVGAPHDDDNGFRSGSAHVFERDPNGAWPQAAKLPPHDGEPYNRFGNAAAISGNVAVVGAYYDEDLGNYSGSAYVFAVGSDDDSNGVMDVCECIGDLDHDCDVDLAQLLSNYGMSEGAVYEDGDLDAGR